ncbi:ribonuclease H-like domain-containing protein [Tanacetum coccineum]
MYVYNSAHNYDNGDDYVKDPVTLISTKNYQVWSCAMLLALEEKNKTGFIDGSNKRSNTDEVLGLDDSYMQIRSSILSIEVLPNVRSVFATISSEESYRVASGSIFGSSLSNHAFAFVSNVPNRENFQRGHSSSGFTDKQLATLISLIKDNKVGKNVHANMTVKSNVNGKIVDSGANKHMTDIDKELDNVYDISHLKIKVAHPNGTEAFISNIGNLKLPNGLVMFDVLVILEYCVTLISVHKLAKENKIFVVIDESVLIPMCNSAHISCLTQHDWHCSLGHPVDPAFNVLKDNLGIENKSQTEFCETCQRAKQTREPFPPSDHNSFKLGDLIHLDL